MAISKNLPSSAAFAGNRGKTLLAAVVSKPPASGRIAIGDHLSIAMALEGKRVCILRPGSPGPSMQRSSLNDLAHGRSDWDELFQRAPAGMRITWSDDCLDRFETLQPAQQQRLIEAVRRLEADFDCVLVETPTGAGLQTAALTRAAALVVFVVTPLEPSPAEAFKTLQALYSDAQQTPRQSFYVLIEGAADLPQAHATFKRLQHTASRYLQLDLHYLGYRPAGEPEGVSLQQLVAALLGAPKQALSRSLRAACERFCGAMEKLEPANGLSDSLHRRCGAIPAEEDATPRRSDAREDRQGAPLNSPADRREPDSDAGLETAMRFAMRLAERR